MFCFCLFLNPPFYFHTILSFVYLPPYFIFINSINSINIINIYIYKEGNVLFNDALNTDYLRLYGVGHMVKDYSVREETRCRHMGYSFRLTSRVLLHAPSHKQDSTYNDLCYTSRGTLEREIAQWVHPMKDRSDIYIYI